MFRALIAFLLGHLRIRVQSRHPGKFLNLCVEHDIMLWDIARYDDVMEAQISLPSFFRIRLVARESHSRVRVVQRRGMPFLAQRLKRRPLLFAGAALCLFAVFWVTGHIWVVDVRHTGEGLLDDRAILAVAAKAGLKPGAWKSRVDIAAVERELAQQVPELSWASVAVKGVHARIQVVEKTSYRPVPGTRTDLVASKQGMIVHVVTMVGEPAVKVGDWVRPGDTLIVGCLHYWAGGRPQVWPGTPVPPRETVAWCGPAEGQVRARVWYQTYLELPLYRETRTPTGRTARRFVLKWGDREILAVGPRKVDFEAADQHRWSLKLPSWRNLTLPVEITSLTAEEVQVHRQQISQLDAVDEAQTNYLRQLQFHLGPNDRVVEVRPEIVQTGQDFVGLRLVVETVEEIGVPQQVTTLPELVPPEESR